MAQRECLREIRRRINSEMLIACGNDAEGQFNAHTEFTE